MRSALAIAAFAITGFAAAQSETQQNYPYKIDPGRVDDADKEKWCLDQTSQCPLICLQQPGVTTSETIKNDCDPDTLLYDCVCDNNVSPNITEYSQTLPYWICTKWQDFCVEDCGQGNDDCAYKCRADHPCGAQSPKPANSSIPTMSKPTETGAAQTGAADPWDTTGNNKNSDKGAASSMLNLGQSYSLAVVFAGVFAGFAIIL